MLTYAIPEKFFAGISSGQFRVDSTCSRIVDAGTGRFVGALVPTNRLENAEQLHAIRPLLEHAQLLSSLGGIASIAYLGISCVGFGLVLKQLSRVEGKLDEALGKIEALRQTIDDLKLDAELLSAARLRSAGECLERAIVSESASTRKELASHARSLFQEARNKHWELARRCRPWDLASMPISAAMDMKARFEAAAVGEIQAEFVGGDMGAFRHAVQSIAQAYSEVYLFDAAMALRVRSDLAISQGPSAIGQFGVELPQLAAELRLANESTLWTHQRLAGFIHDATLAEELGAEPYEVAAATRRAPEGALSVLVAA